MEVSEGLGKVEYIEREKLIKHLADEIAGCSVCAGSRANGKGVAYGTALGLKMAKSFVETLPAADVVEVRHGEWIVHTHHYECSNCGFEYETDVFAEDYNPITDFYLHFCSVCGAKMKDGE